MGLETAGLIMAGSALAGTGAGIVTSIKQQKQQKELAKKQETSQKQKQAKLQTERKKKIDLMRSQLLAPSLFGGRRSLRSGSERGLTGSVQREVLG